LRWERRGKKKWEEGKPVRGTDQRAKKGKICRLKITYAGRMPCNRAVLSIGKKERSSTGPFGLRRKREG